MTRHLDSYFHLLPVLLLVLLNACSESDKVDTSEIKQKSQLNPPVTMTSKYKPVTDARIINADAEPQNWLSYGRSYNEQRFSSLLNINTGNIQKLKLAWHHDLPTRRGLEATPLIVDGRMYTTGTWSRVYALDAATGELLWEFDPRVPPQKGIDACCDVVNRGVAVWQHNVYVGTLDGRLIALDAMTGREVWSVNTFPDDRLYTITGAPRIVNGKVLIGNGGSESNARGFVTAYDAATGEQVWRFYTVPGDPALPFENPALKKAVSTWKGEWWHNGGGGTVWDAITYDPDLNLVYIGVGNGTPWNQQFRSPGGGDNLFLASIVALNADNGEYVWHYQTAPGETWDFTATQHIMLADLKIEGQVRKVLMQAPKNGFFYVLDRQTGELLSAKPYVDVNWATHVDMQSGRPVETENARYSNGEFASFPAAPGGHNWQPMAFHPDTGLVYIPAQDLPWVYKSAEHFEFHPLRVSSGLDPVIASMPEDPKKQEEISKLLKGYLIGWDPVKQEARWKVEHPVAWNGGVLATAGNLLFQGTAHGEFKAFAADTGEELWSSNVQTSALGGPVTYMVDGKQYVAVMAGWGTAFGIESGIVAKWAGVPALNRIVAFSLDGNDVLPDLPAEKAIPEPPLHTASAERVTKGKFLYHQYCTRCHGDAAISARVIPDLRHLDEQTHAQWKAIVIGGARFSKGMPTFASVLSAEDSSLIHDYVIKRAHDGEYVPPPEYLNR